MNPSFDDWLPKSVILLRSYDRHKFLSDLIAGVTVGLVALPLAMAFAISSGLSPQAGLYCAVVTGFLISALGGSKTRCCSAAHASNPLNSCTKPNSSVTLAKKTSSRASPTRFAGPMSSTRRNTPATSVGPVSRRIS